VIEHIVNLLIIVVVGLALGMVTWGIGNGMVTFAKWLI